jgi:hypothetical protein
MGFSAKESWIMEILIRNRRVLFDQEDLFTVINTKWYISEAGYVANSNHGYLHRIIMDAPADKVIDHLNSNKLDNRKCNLRITDQSYNTQNSMKAKFKGVYDTKRSVSRYEAYIHFNYEKIYLGVGSSLEAAAVKYDMAAIYLYGEFAGLNFPDRRSEYLEQLKEVDKDGV